MSIKYLERENLPKIAYRLLEADEKGADLPLVMFCGGFRSDMEGTKAQFLHDLCKSRGQAYIRFDYRGHGSSGGTFEESTIGDWAADALAVLDHLTSGSVLLVGSSMGGWVSLLLMLARPARIAGMVGIAAAADFTRDIYNNEMDDAMRATLDAQGYLDVPSEYGPEPYRITKRLIDEGETHCLLDGNIDINAPVVLLHGMKDDDVPWQTAYRIKNAIGTDDLCEVVMIESGDHRLSRAEDLNLLADKVRRLSEEIRQ